MDWDLPGPKSEKARRWWAVAAAVAGATLLVFACFLAGRVAREGAAAGLTEQARAAWPLATATLTGEIEKQRLIPLALARDQAVITILQPHTAASETALNLKLRAIADDARDALIYVIDATGRTIAASNANEPTSFVGANYRFRHYFQDAMANGSATQYTLGTVSNRPGLYLSRRIDGADSPLGVIVDKVELTSVESSWEASGFIVYVTDEAGIVLATNTPDWRFHAMSPLSQTDAAVRRASLQLENADLLRVPLRRHDGGHITAEIDGQSKEFVSASGAIGQAAPGWRLTLLVPVDWTLVEAERRGQLIALLSLLLAGGLIFVLWRRRKIIRFRQETLARVNAELEARVGLRTVELVQANKALAAEMADRENAETKVHKLRDELAQANRLSILGQIAAGVAHEMNQPLAAIRTYADNTKQLLASDKKASAAANLDSILGLTDRISVTTEALRSFARRATGPIGPLSVDAAIKGALSLLSSRVRDAGVTIAWTPRSAPVMVMASRIQLEQILVNLLQNALDALKDRPAPRIEILLAETDETIRLSLKDNGPGLDPEIRASLFMPFTTSKEKGLGLGLVISNEIAREFGGTLQLDSECAEGTTFTLELRRSQ